jgi:hypothetical protein
MSPVPRSPSVAVYNSTSSVQTFEKGLHHLSKRINLNPFHYVTLPIKNNWAKVAPFLDKYNKYSHIIAVLLGGLSLFVMLDNHKWKLPRWPWAKDNLKDPQPSFRHDNQRMTVDELAEKKLMEMLKEMKTHVEKDELTEEQPLSMGAESDESESEEVQRSEEQFIEDAQIGVEDVVEEMEGE